MASLDLYSLTLAVGDPVNGSDPSLRYVDWRRTQKGIQVANPSVDSRQILPRQSLSIIDSVRSLNWGSDTTLTLSVSTLSSTRYRLTYAGSQPVFRTDSGLTLSNQTVTATDLNNGSMTFTAPTGFGSVQVGDTIFIPGLMTGDASGPFSPLNQGFWSVIGLVTNGVMVTRLPGQEFQGISESVAVTSNSQIVAFAPEGVQVNDKVKFNSSFSPINQNVYTVESVTPTWIEFTSTTPLLPEEISSNSALIVYGPGTKRYLKIEVDQDCVVQCNGDSSPSQIVSPWYAGDPQQVGQYIRTGPCWLLTIQNLSDQTLNLTVISAE